jgi:hypothetical protein
MTLIKLARNARRIHETSKRAFVTKCGRHVPNITEDNALQTLRAAFRTTHKGAKVTCASCILHAKH